MLPDAAMAARHPAVAEFVIEQLQASNAALQASLRALLARPEPLAPDAVRAALARQPQALEFSADAI
jgi:hypothetical protein